MLSKKLHPYLGPVKCRLTEQLKNNIYINYNTTVEYVKYSQICNPYETIAMELYFRLEYSIGNLF